MTLLPEIRGQLLDAAFDGVEPRAGVARGRLLGTLAIAVSIVVSAAVATVVLLSLHGSAAPTSGPAGGSTGGPTARPPVAWVKALGRAGQSTQQRDSACRLPSRFRVGEQRYLTTAPPRSVTSILPSLASPARGALGVTVSELRALQVDANGIYVRYAWQGQTDGIRYYVVPAAVVGTTKIVPVRCYREALATFRQEARRFPASQRAPAIAYAQQRFNPQAASGVAVITVGAGLRSESNYPGWMLAELKTDPAFGQGGGGSNNSTTTTVLVTDQVGSVTAAYGAHSVTKRPVRNFVIFQVTGAWNPPRLTFRPSTGAVISRTPKR